ncbi:MAG: hypothetical protein IKN43_15165, partial [Selenomonadaceae bacterium]|nr:hypothetical protein [Selenomonadaceae bacterium]
MKNKKKLTSNVKKYIFLGMISLYMTTASVGFGADSKLGIIEKKNSNLPNLKIYNSNLPESEYSAWSTINLDKKMVIIGSKEDTVLFNADKAWHFYGGYTISANELKNYTLIIDKITGENVNAYGGHTNDRELVSDN